jgi:hypothetical protein
MSDSNDEKNGQTNKPPLDAMCDAADQYAAELNGRIDRLAADENRLLAEDPERYWRERRSIEAAVAINSALNDATLGALQTVVLAALPPVGGQQ